MMQLQEITYATILSNKADLECIIKGDNLKMLKNTNSPTMKDIKNGVFVPFSKLNECIHKQLDDLEYIIFWENITIYIQRQIKEI